MIEIDWDTYAKGMFEAYNAQGPNPGKTHDGRDVPPWEQLGGQVRAKWVAAAKAARDSHPQALPEKPLPGGHTCPRRTEIGRHRPPFGCENADLYQDREGARCCSYCGSLHPDDFMEKAAAGVELGPTDKSYKVYVSDAAAGSGGKFYFQHLSVDQQQRFVDLLNEKKLKIGVPGHFYARPFFIGTAKPIAP